MSVNPLGELDMELDEVLVSEESARWSAYRWWTFGWTVLFVIWGLVGTITITLILADEPFDAGVIVLIVLTVGLVVTSMLGYRARERWRRALSLRTGR